MARFRDPVPFPLQLFFGLIATLFFILVLKSLGYARGKKLWSDYRVRRGQRRRRGRTNHWEEEDEDGESYDLTQRPSTTTFAESYVIQSILDVDEWTIHSGNRFYYNPWWAADVGQTDSHDRGFRPRPYTPENSPPSSTPSLSPSPRLTRTRPSFDLYFRPTPRVTVTPPEERSPRHSRHSPQVQEIPGDDDTLPAYEPPPTYLESFYLKP